MTYFNFDRLINKYGLEITIIKPGNGKYIGGVWQTEPGEEYKVFGAVMSLSQNKIYQLGGTIASQDRYLYMLNPIEEPLQGIKVIINSNLYSVESSRDKGKEKFTGVYVYLLKWVSVFDRYKKN